MTCVPVLDTATDCQCAATALVAAHDDPESVLLQIWPRLRPAENSHANITAPSLETVAELQDEGVATLDFVHDAPESMLV